MKILSILFLSLSLNGFGQVTEEILLPPPSQEEDSIKPMEICNSPDSVAQFPEGMDNFRSYITNHLIYPPAALVEGIQGKVYAQFTVSIDGTISDVKIMRGLRKDCDDEVVRMILAMPKWESAIYEGKKVNSKMIIPVSFMLDR